MTTATTQPATAEPQFADPEDVTFTELRHGDFVVSFPAQRGIRGAVINSGIKAIVSDWHAMYETSRPRGPRMPIEAKRVWFLSGTTIAIPASFTVTVRRRLA
jgi:hypothetical protein